MLRLRTILAALTLTLTACAESNDPSPNPNDDFGTPPEQLEAISVKGDSDYITADRHGALAVTGSERDFSLTITDAAGDKALTVHTPGTSDLTALDGKTVTLSLGDGMDGERSMLIKDEAGPLYLAQMGSYGIDAEALFGADFVSYGEPVAVETEEETNYSVTWKYTPIVFKTDSGDVSLLPGEVKPIVLGGKTYRAAAIAAYKVQYDEEISCGPSSLLAYELLRVDAPPPALKLVRPPKFTRATASCGI